MSSGPPPHEPDNEQPNIICPDCGWRSYHPDDIKWGYCGRCHAFTSAGTVHQVNAPQPEVDP